MATVVLFPCMDQFVKICLFVKVINGNFSCLVHLEGRIVFQDRQILDKVCHLKIILFSLFSHLTICQAETVLFFQIICLYSSMKIVSGMLSLEKETTNFDLFWRISAGREEQINEEGLTMLITTQEQPPGSVQQQKQLEIMKTGRCKLEH